jgi:hypothetical protein
MWERTRWAKLWDLTKWKISIILMNLVCLVYAFFLFFTYFLVIFQESQIVPAFMLNIASDAKPAVFNFYKYSVHPASEKEIVTLLSDPMGLGLIDTEGESNEGTSSSMGTSQSEIWSQDSLFADNFSLRNRYTSRNERELLLREFV